MNTFIQNNNNTKYDTLYKTTIIPNMNTFIQNNNNTKYEYIYTKEQYYQI